MSLNRNLAWPALAAMAIAFWAPWVHGDTIHDVVDWVVHNEPGGGASVTDGATNSPTFSPATGNMTVMGTFPKVTLANDGDFITATTTLMLDTRPEPVSGTNFLNTQLRFGIFDGPDGPVVAEDIPNRGIFMFYNNNGGRIREADPAQTNPFNGFTAEIGNLNPDPEGDSIQGTDIGPVDFELTLTRNGGMIDISGQISGTDSVSGNPFLSVIDPVLSHAPGAAGFDFSFDRVGFSFRNNVQAPNGTLADVIVTTNVPEPSSAMLVASLVLGGVVMGRRTSRRRDG